MITTANIGTPSNYVGSGKFSMILKKMKEDAMKKRLKPILIYPKEFENNKMYFKAPDLS
jgi:hypothetical protein